MEPRDPRATIPGRNGYDDAARDERRAWWESTTGVDAAPVASAVLEGHDLRGHVENFVGAVAVPLGLAGPLLFTGEAATGLVTAPMATTEGALVAATSRGARALTEAGGVTTRVIARHMTRAPLFGFRDGTEAARFVEWVMPLRGDLATEARAGSEHTRLLDVHPYVIGRDVHLLLSFDTGDAAGQNMVTMATARICAWIARRLAGDTTIELVMSTVEGQLSGDKNLSFLNAIHGRGARVAAEAFLPRAIVENVLKVSPEDLARAHHAGTAAALQAGVIGYNANVANVVAALFIATGQDVACVHESSLSILTLDAAADGVYASLLLTSLIVGTVGGGTTLPGQRACLESLGCGGDGRGRAPRLAEIIGGFCLALDLSSYAAMVSGDFASAHAKLGRKSSRK